MPKMILIILIDSVLKKHGNYFSQVFLEKCKYIEKLKKMTRYITDDLGISCDDSDEEYCYDIVMKNELNWDLFKKGKFMCTKSFLK